MVHGIAGIVANIKAVCSHPAGMAPLLDDTTKSRILAME